MQAPNGMHMITVGTQTGPWHVSSFSTSIPSSAWNGYSRRKPSGSWYVVNMLTGRSKKIGPIKMKGTNYFDRARDVCQERNRQFFLEHKEDLPTFMGRNSEFDKVIAMILGDTTGASAEQLFFDRRPRIRKDKLA